MAEVKGAKELERKTNRQLVKLQSEESKLIQLETELSNNPQFIQFLEAQKQLQKKTDEFWSGVKEQMIENGVTEIKVDTDYATGKLTISYVKSYEAKDIEKVADKFIAKALDTKKVAAHVESTQKLPKGVTEKGFHRLNKTLKSKDIVS